MVGLTLASVLSVSSALLADTVELFSGQRYDNCQVIKAQWDNVQFKVANAPAAQSSAGDKVFLVRRDSPLLQSPRSAIESGNADKAIRELEAIKAAPGDKVDDWRKAEAEFLLGRAYRAGGDLKKAIDAYKQYIDGNKAAKDWFLPHATLEMAETMLLARQPGTAELAFRELGQFGSHWVIRAKLGEAQSALGRNGVAEAMKIRGLTDEVLRNRDATVELKNQALVIRGKVLLLQKNPKQAISELTQGFFAAAKTDIDYSYERAEATLLMGKAHLAEGSREGQEQAEIWFLRVPALYKRHVNLYNEACDLLVELYEKEGNQARAAQWRARKSGAKAAPSAGSGEKTSLKPGARTQQYTVSFAPC